ncbi:MAG: hypothetical protein FWC16_13075 [Defluviitaleaceae bacterium]|nr:hypothetical protein [Defluviitaleaceae bacterium]MCL2275853.1 hypothetical protein [Defluviitaleaceae bacterium]
MFRATIYIETNADGTIFYSLNRGGKHFICTNIPEIAKQRKIFPFYVMVANTPRAVIRTAPLPHKRGKLTAQEKWALVKSVFPLGTALNESTHVFDGCVCGESFYMTALPLEIAEEITQAGAALLGAQHRIHRLETIEGLLFKRFCAQPSTGVRYIIFPQDTGLRTLVIADGAPHSVFTIPTIEELREDALMRAVQNKTPEEIILLAREDWVDDWDENLSWVSAFFEEKSITVTGAKF